MVSYDKDLSIIISNALEQKLKKENNFSISPFFIIAFIFIRDPNSEYQILHLSHFRDHYIDIGLTHLLPNANLNTIMISTTFSSPRLSPTCSCLVLSCVCIQCILIYLIQVNFSLYKLLNHLVINLLTIDGETTHLHVSPIHHCQVWFPFSRAYTHSLLKKRLIILDPWYNFEVELPH